MAKKTICFDFDGVIHSYTSGWKGTTEIPDPPVDPEQMKEEFLKLKEEGYEIVICSTRCASYRGIEAITDWLIKYDLREYIDAICNRKPPAIVYIDDRGLHFDGKWEGMADKIMNFRSWLER